MDRMKTVINPDLNKCGQKPGALISKTINKNLSQQSSSRDNICYLE